MLCRRCEDLSSRFKRQISVRRVRSAWSCDRLNALICEQCGAALPLVSSTEIMLEKISQLARFGLTTGARVLLEPTGNPEVSR